jgi:hypothetical protein
MDVYSQCGRTTVHHLNLDGKAGQKRLGHDFTIPLGEWHHQGVVKNGWTERTMTAVYGPSLAKQSKAFRSAFGDDEELLEATNEMLQGALCD